MSHKSSWNSCEKMAVEALQMKGRKLATTLAEARFRTFERVFFSAAFWDEPVELFSTIGHFDQTKNLTKRFFSANNWTCSAAFEIGIFDQTQVTEVLFVHTKECTGSGILPSGKDLCYEGQLLVETFKVQVLNNNGQSGSLDMQAIETTGVSKNFWAQWYLKSQRNMIISKNLRFLRCI